MPAMKFTAQEAKKLAEDSDAHLEELLDYIGTEIKKVANTGVRHLIFETTPHQELRDLFKQERFSLYHPKPLAVKIQAALKTAGYIVGDEFFEDQIGGGYPGDPDEPRIERVTKTVVRW
jgi:hypothetical protein